MYTREEATIGREVRAIQIPDGAPVILDQGTQVLITQELGGSFTVMTERGAMYRIDERDADALGREAPAADPEEIEGSLEDRVWAQLRKCYDPEIPVNVVDLGLIYDCTIRDGEGEDGPSTVRIQMTLTAPGCGMGPVLAEDVRRRLEDLEEIATAEVEVVFDPPWNPNMMTEAARLQLGLM